MRRRSGRLQGKGPMFMGEVDDNDKVVGGGASRKRKAEGEAESSSDEEDGGLVDMAGESQVDWRAMARTWPCGVTGIRAALSCEVGFRGMGALCMDIWVMRGGWHQRAF